ncbi:MAG: acetate--CoA ligase family protein [Deltaproteobacteria bacterium]|nr:acetate--CoA ligase family protein [Deltaproteobacteria bacterium]
MDLAGFFEARRIAIVGASPEGYFSDRLRENLEASEGIEVLPVNPGRRRVWGAKAFPDLESLPADPDLVIVLVGARQAVATVQTMSRLGLERAVLLASDFGKAEMKKLRSVDGVAVLGPESLGLMDVPAARFAFCGRLTFPTPPGRISIVSRSGGLLVECLRTLREDPRWGIRRAVCCGRQALLGAGDVLEALASDGQTDAVILLLEKDPCAASLVGPIESLARAGKETILFSTAGRGLRDPEALLHADGGEVLESNAVEALASSTGALHATSMDEVAEAAALVSSRPQGRGRGGHAFLVSVSAGVGQWMERASREAGLELASAGRTLRRTLAGAQSTNPIDLTAEAVTDAAVLERTVTACTRQKGVGAVIVCMHPPWGKTYSDRRNARWLEFLASPASSGGPLVMAVQPTAAVADPVPGLARGIEGACRMAAWWTASRPAPPRRECEDEDARASALRILHGPARGLSEPASRKLLTTYGIDFDPWHLAETPSQAASRARSLAGQVCLKIASPDIAPSMPGCTQGPVRGDAAVRRAYMDLLEAGRESDPDARVLGVLVTPHRQGDRALFAATLSRGDGAPPLIICGPGGDVRRVTGSYVPRLTPLTRRAALDLASKTTALSRSEGDRATLAELLERLARFAHDFRDEVGVVDLGAIVPIREGWRCLDARVAIRRRVDGR